MKTQVLYILRTYVAIEFTLGQLIIHNNIELASGMFSFSIMCTCTLHSVHAVYVCMYVCMYVYVHTMCVCVCVCVCVRVRVCVNLQSITTSLLCTYIVGTSGPFVSTVVGT